MLCYNNYYNHKIKLNIKYFKKISDFIKEKIEF